MIEQLCEYLWNLIPSSVKPRFVGDIPSQSDEGVALSLYGTEGITRFFGSNISLIEQMVQCNIRTEKYEKGTKFMQQIIESLDKYHNEQDGILSVLLSDGDNDLGVNEEKLHEFQLTFKILAKEEK